jgi:hypothetical protein
LAQADKVKTTEAPKRLNFPFRNMIKLYSPVSWVKARREREARPDRLRHPSLEALLKGSGWEGGKWQWFLRRLPGVRPEKPRSWGGRLNARGLFLPAGLLDDSDIDRRSAEELLQ